MKKSNKKQEKLYQKSLTNEKAFSIIDNAPTKSGRKTIEYLL